MIFRNLLLSIILGISTFVSLNLNEIKANELDQILNIGREKLSESDYKGALKEFNKIIKNYPKIWQAFHNRGLSKFKLGDLKGALEDFTKAIELNDNSWAESYLQRAYINGATGNYDDSISDFTKAIEKGLDKYSEEQAYYLRGLAKSILEDFKGSISDFSKVIKLNPNNFEAYNERGSNQELIGNIISAKDDYQKALQIKPFNESSLNFLENLDKRKGKLISDLYKKIDIEVNKKNYKKIINLNKEIILTFEKFGEVSSIPYSSIAWNYYEIGNYKLARSYQQKALKIEKDIYGFKSERVANLLDALVVFYYEKGISLDKKYFAEVLKITQESLAIKKIIFDKNSIKIAEGYQNLSNIFREKGDFNKSIELKNKAINIAENSFDKDDSSSIQEYKIFLYSQIAADYNIIGDLFKSKKYIEKAIKSINLTPKYDENLLGENYLQLGIISMQIGDFDEGINNLNNSLKILKKNKKQNINSIREGEKILEVAQEMKIALENKDNNYANIKPLFKGNISEDDPEAIFKLSTNANILIMNGSFKESIKLNEKAKSLILKKKGRNNFESYKNSKDLGMAYLYMDDLDNAEKNLKEAYKIFNKLFYDSINSHETNQIYENLALLNLNKGLYDETYKFINKLIDNSIILVKEQSQYFPEIYRKNFSTFYLRNYDTLFSLISIFPEAKTLALKARINRQGILEDIEKYQSRILQLGNKEKELFDNLKSIESKLSNYSIVGDKRKNLIIQKIQLEESLYEKIPNLKANVFEINDVKKVLPSNSVLIEFQKYQPIDLKRVLNKNLDRIESLERYGALILNSSGEVNFVDLGLAKIIEKDIENALYSTKQYLDDADDLWNKLGNLIFNPIIDVMGDSDTLFISPDSELNRVPFAALGVNNSNRYLGETYKLRLLTTGRELLSIEDDDKYQTNQSLVLANPLFDLKNNNKINNNQTNYSLVQKRSADFKYEKFENLPGTEKEGKLISSLIDGKLLLNEKATVLAVQKIPSPKIVHIASHAKFISDNKDKRNPLLRGMIILAGANNPKSNILDDGILTALEITRLNWTGTDLVVVSACESGLGEISSGEGIYGLKRAISVAGAKSSLLSLWKVNDLATAEFMESFYLKLKKGEGKAEALANTQTEFRNGDIPEYRHPNVWAAFQLNGDWGQVDF